MYIVAQYIVITWPAVTIFLVISPVRFPAINNIETIFNIIETRAGCADFNCADAHN